MKIKFIIIAIISLAFSTTNGNAQGFTPPSEGKAVVYFTRVTAMGAMVSFEFFHQDKYIGLFKGKNYMRYECEPGEQLFWASSENKEFITADLEAGKTYVVLVDVVMGAMKARVGLRSIDSNHETFARAKKLIDKKKPVVTSQEVIDKKTKKLNKRGFIAEKLKMYETEWKDSKNFKHISPEMAIPEEQL